MASWTEKCVSQLKLLHEEGFSATVIAKKLGPDFTKGMVLGKLSRLALAEAPKKPQKPEKRLFSGSFPRGRSRPDG